MIDQKLKINILAFDPIEENLEFSFFRKQKKGTSPLHISQAPMDVAESFRKQANANEHFIYSDFTTSQEADYTVKINLLENNRFGKHYFNHLIRQYFQDKANFIKANFADDTELWFKDNSKNDSRFTAYNVFTIRIQYSNLSNGYELVLFRNSLSKILKTGIADLSGLDEKLYRTVQYQNNLFHFKKLPDEARYNLQEVFPLVTSTIGSQLNINEYSNPFKNRYPEIQQDLLTFIDNYFANDEFSKVIQLKSTDLLAVPAYKLSYVGDDSHLLQVGSSNNKVSVTSPKGNVKRHGPFSLPDKERTVKFIMIFHKNDRDYANRLVLIFQKKYLNDEGKLADDRFGTSLYDHIRLKFDLDAENSIQFENNLDPFTAIDDYLGKTDLDHEKYNYVAIYLSPFNKDETDIEKKKVYYRVKETLIRHMITSQAIYRENILKKDFVTLHYANIAAAILAKAGGIPWQLDTKVKPELIVGIGAFENQEIGVKYIGSAFSFSTSGEFKEFNCRTATETNLLAQEIKISVQDFIKKEGKLDRVIIHFYKKMSDRDIRPIQKALFHLGFKDIPIIVITVNKSVQKDFIAFDNSYSGLMPYSGTIINLARNEYLLFNNTRYASEPGAKIESYHKPIKLKFQSTNPEILENDETIKELIDQVYQFSRMYWKSVKQQNLPITIKYPELVAKMYPYFNEEDLNEFGRTNMWFI